MSTVSVRLGGCWCSGRWDAVGMREGVVLEVDMRMWERVEVTKRGVGKVWTWR